MNTLLKSAGGITQVSADSRLLSNRLIFLEGKIDAGSAGEFVRQILILNQESTEKAIRVLVNSAGGEISSGLMIYDAIQGSRAPVELYCIGHAYSMAAVIVACGSHGRYILPHGEMMIHEPMHGQQVAGNSSSIRSISEGLLEMKGRINRLLAKHTKRSEEEIEKATAYDHFFSPEESVEFGLCDEIVGFEKILEPIL